MNKRFEAVLMLDEEAQDKKYGDCQVVQMGSQYYYLVPIEDQWISVEDRLPEKNQYVDIFQFGNRVPDVQFEGDCFYDNEYDRTYELKNVTHWMPLPTSPKDTEQTKEK